MPKTRPRGRAWVCKSDVVQYRKCPYAFWLIDKGEVDLDKIFGDLQRGMLERGLAFEREIVGRASPIDIPAKGLAETLRRLSRSPKSEKVALLDVPLFENLDLRLYGKPDGIAVQRGALVPIEIKWHRDIKHTDLLELAFYWLLLDPHRTRKSQPRGVLILGSTTADEREVEVEIQEPIFKQLHQIVRDIRQARQQGRTFYGIQPEICGCEVCVTRPEIGRAVTSRRGTSLIYGVASSRAKVLAALGIRTIDDILDCDEVAVVERLKPHRHFVSLPVVRQWKYHAKSYLENAPVFFGNERWDIGSFIAVDLEYDSFRPGSIYLIGAALVEEGVTSYQQWWSDDREDVAANLRAFVEFVNKHPGLPVVTWAGDAAEIPELQKAGQIYRMTKILRRALLRHRDAFRFVERNVRFPIPTLDLKQVGHYFRIQLRTDVAGGLEAMSLWFEYQRARSKKKKAALKRLLLDYNRDDLDTLVEIVARVRMLSSKGDPIAAVLRF